MPRSKKVEVEVRVQTGGTAFHVTQTSSRNPNLNSFVVRKNTAREGLVISQRGQSVYIFPEAYDAVLAAIDLLGTNGAP